MFRGIPFVALVAGTVFLLPPTSPSSPTPPPATTTRYRLDSHTQTVVDLSGFGMPNQDVGVDITAWIAVTLSDSAGGRTAHTVVDSIKYQGVAPTLSMEAADSAKGGTLHGFIAPDGRLREMTFRPAGNLFLAAVREMLQGLFARVKAGAGPGERWSDTVEIATNIGGANTQSRAMIDYVAVGPETVAGSPGLKFESKSALTITGTIDSPPMGMMEISGTGTGVGSHSVGLDGTFGGGSATVKLNQTLKSGMAPLPIPVATTTTLQVTRLP